MQEIISTFVRTSKKAAESIWLDGGKLLRSGYNKGDTLDITSRNDAIILTKVAPVKRSSESTQNVSGRKNVARDEIMPILELPIKKTGMLWDAGTPLKVKVTKTRIVIRVNSYLLERKKRAAKFSETLKTRKAKHLRIEVQDVPTYPRKNETESADLCTVRFDTCLESKATSSFYNTLCSIERANPFAIVVFSYQSHTNPLGEGIVSILRSMAYNTYFIDGILLAVSQDILIDDDWVDLFVEPDEPSLDYLLAIEHSETLTCQFGEKLALKENRQSVLETDIKNGVMSIASTFHGGGTYEAGAAPVFKANNLKPELVLVSEIEDSYLQHSFEINRSAFTDNTIVLNGDMDHFDLSNCAIKSSLFLSGISCIGASRAGISKGQYGVAELHSSAGHLFWSTIKYIIGINSYFYILENTDSYKKTDSYKSIKLILDEIGYFYEEGILNSHDFGATESRNRLFLIASSDDSNHVHAIEPFSKKHHFVGPRITINHLLDPAIDEDSKMYREYDHLKQKAIRDAKDGKGFGRTLFTGSETKSLVIRAQYAKAGSSDCYHIHPLNPELSRLYSVLEHSRLKGFDDSFILNSKTNTATLGHTILGQGIPRPVSAITSGFICQLVDRIIANVKTHFELPVLRGESLQLSLI